MIRLFWNIVDNVCNSEAAYRTGFDHKYPYAYSTYESKLRHQEHAQKVIAYASRRAEYHERKAEEAVVRRARRR